MRAKKVAVLMSGGVDSSTAAYILSREGYEVIGVTLKLWNCGTLTELTRQLCCSPQDIYDAKNVSAKIGIQHYILDFSKEFEEYIIRQFCKKYIEGFTPNPCIWCNSKIKFYLAFQKLKKFLNIDYIASGHYAKIVKKNSSYFIVKGKDDVKEQSYFLCNILPEMLKYIILPLGELTKNEVKQIALQAGLENVVYKKESFDLCFVPEGDYRKFLESQGYKIFSKGKIIDLETGDFLGYHRGYVNYTIGQRIGVGIKNLPSRKYVVKIVPESNTLYVGDEKKLYRDSLVMSNCVFYEKISRLHLKKLYAKIRYKSSFSRCSIIKVYKDKVKIKFEEPQRAVTPGQYAVVYDEDNRIVISGEIILENCL
ncbi:MAG: tRNA 2-thiouridine(34) synthase MnmA [Endomicrobia bacterium]|nr:tRNA 2-thiouridine(34) synthase MnmA [Endomicrobiia bacterium]MCX7716255.1 tRNA 2-thiouridine(34) synthase MnmA [Endomicrobiia bacterium]